MTTRKAVLLDCDGPLSDFEAKTIEWVRSFDAYRNWVPAATWDLDSNLPDDMREWLNEQWRGPGFAESLELVPGARRAVEVIEQVADVYIVTSPMKRSRTWHYERTEWLVRRFDLSSRRVIFAEDKHLVFGHVLVDDKVSNLETWENHRRGKPLLWYTDRNVEKHGEMLGATSWAGMLPLVLEALR